MDQVSEVLSRTNQILQQAGFARLTGHKRSYFHPGLQGHLLVCTLLELAQKGLYNHSYFTAQSAFHR